MRLSDICRPKPITESIRTDFFDMYLLSSLPYSDDPEVEALLTDRVDRLIEHFREQLYLVFLLRLDLCFAIEKRDSARDKFDSLLRIKDPRMMWEVISNVVRDGDLFPTLFGPSYSDGTLTVEYEYSNALHGNWVEVAELFSKLCDPPKNTKSKVALLDKLFGMAHNNGSLTDWLGDPIMRQFRDKGPAKSNWMFDALYTRALAHPNELARYASDDARKLATTSDIGYGLGSSLSSYKPVTDADKLNLFKSKESAQLPITHRVRWSNEE